MKRGGGGVLAVGGGGGGGGGINTGLKSVCGRLLDKRHLLENY